jgi:hypothetical protein
MKYPELAIDTDSVGDELLARQYITQLARCRRRRILLSRRTAIALFAFVYTVLADGPGQVSTII